MSLAGGGGGGRGEGGEGGRRWRSGSVDGYYFTFDSVCTNGKCLDRLSYMKVSSVNIIAYIG